MWPQREEFMRLNILVLFTLVYALAGCSVKAGPAAPVFAGLPKPAPQPAPTPAPKLTFNVTDSANVWRAIQVNTNNPGAQSATARINLRCTRTTIYSRPNCAGGVVENNYMASFAGDGFVTLFNDHLKTSADKLVAEGRIYVDCKVANTVPTCDVTDVQNPNYVP